MNKPINLHMSSAKCHCLNNGLLCVKVDQAVCREREVNWIYKVCLPQHSDAPPSAFYPVNQFCCFVLFKELCLWKRMLSACRFSLLLHPVCRSRLMLLPGSACCIIMNEVDSARMQNLLKFIMSFGSLSLLSVKTDSKVWWFGRKVWDLICTWRCNL